MALKIRMAWMCLFFVPCVCVGSLGCVGWRRGFGRRKMVCNHIMEGYVRCFLHWNLSSVHIYKINWQSHEKHPSIKVFGETVKQLLFFLFAFLVIQFNLCMQVESKRKHGSKPIPQSILRRVRELASIYPYPRDRKKTASVTSPVPGTSTTSDKFFPLSSAVRII